MKKIVYLIAICIGIWWMVDSCSGGGSDSSSRNGEEYSEGRETERSNRHRYNFESITFDTPASVIGFMGGKTFTNGNSGIRLSGNNMELIDGGGTTYGTITNVRVIGADKAVIEANFPRLSTTISFGIFLLDNGAYVIDSLTHTTFELE